MAMKLLDLPTMLHKKEEHECVTTKNIGQKLFIATRMGIKLLHHRLLKGKQKDFDTTMGELIRTKVAIGDARPLAGSRKHYSLTKKEKWQSEEVPDQQTRNGITSDRKMYLDFLPWNSHSGASLVEAGSL